MKKYAENAKKERPDDYERVVRLQKRKIEKELENLDWDNWLGVAPKREYWPELYHDFKWRGWWDFGSGALGDMACHQVTVPFASCGLKDPVSVVAKTTGHDFDSFPESSIIEFQFPETSERPAIQTAMHVDFHQVKELPPGHALVVKKDGALSIDRIREAEERKSCSFERIYFSR